MPLFFSNLGKYEPGENECDWPSDEEGEDSEQLSDEMKAKAKIEDEKKRKDDEDKHKDLKGVPEFWLTIFKNVDMLQEMVQEHDELALASLLDITVTLTKKPMVRYWSLAYTAVCFIGIFLWKCASFL